MGELQDAHLQQLSVLSCSSQHEIKNSSVDMWLESLSNILKRSLWLGSIAFSWPLAFMYIPLKHALLFSQNEPLGKLMKRYAGSQNVSLESLKFEFDGEEISPQNTPDELELEENFCIDVIAC